MSNFDHDWRKTAAEVQRQQQEFIARWTAAAEREIVHATRRYRAQLPELSDECIVKLVQLDMKHTLEARLRFIR